MTTSAAASPFDNPFYVFLESSRFCTFEKLVCVSEHHGEHRKDGEGRGASMDETPLVKPIKDAIELVSCIF